MRPLITEIPFQDPCQVFSHLAEDPFAIFLDSSKYDPSLGAYSFIGMSPFLTIKSFQDRIICNEEVTLGNPFYFLQEKLKEFRLENCVDFPPFQGGAAGYFAYDLAHHLEKLPKPKTDDSGLPDMAVGFYDLVMAFDLNQKKAWIFSSGFPKLDGERLGYAQERVDWLLEKLKQNTKPITPEKIFSQNVKANFTADHYEAAVKKAIRYIEEGDIFEVNLAQRFSAELSENSQPYELYQKLRIRNPATFSAYFNCVEGVIASASPERFLKLESGLVETRPIKGTRPRGKNPEEDMKFAEELIHSEKDHAENVMIVDLMRNDLSRVCDDHSVIVQKLCGLESFATVHHLVSVVTGKLKSDKDAIDLLKATFPGGSITGAPKIRAMEIIAEIEPNLRGPYCGSVGYIGFNGDMDTSITIRTFVIKNNKTYFHAGGAIVADSDPKIEYEETLHKAHALKEVLLT